MAKRALVILIMATAIMLSAGMSWAELLNGGFETLPFPTGWTTTGSWYSSPTKHTGLYSANVMAGTIQQDLTGLSGGYTLSFWIRDGSDDSSWKVYWDQGGDSTIVPILSGTGKNFDYAWHQYTATVAGDGTLKFVVEQNSGTKNFRLDDVTLTQNSSVPIPSAFLLLAPGLAGLAVLRKKFRFMGKS